MEAHTHTGFHAACGILGFVYLVLGLPLQLALRPLTWK